MGSREAARGIRGLQLEVRIVGSTVNAQTHRYPCGEAIGQRSTAPTNVAPAARAPLLLRPAPQNKSSARIMSYPLFQMLAGYLAGFLWPKYFPGAGSRMSL